MFEMVLRQNMITKQNIEARASCKSIYGNTKVSVSLIPAIIKSSKILMISTSY
jgi:hypothetical protein